MNFCPMCGEDYLTTTTMGFASSEVDPNIWHCDNCKFEWRAVVSYEYSALLIDEEAAMDRTMRFLKGED